MEKGFKSCLVPSFNISQQICRRNYDMSQRIEILHYKWAITVHKMKKKFAFRMNSAGKILNRCENAYHVQYTILHSVKSNICGMANRKSVLGTEPGAFVFRARSIIRVRGSYTKFYPQICMMPDNAHSETNAAQNISLSHALCVNTSNHSSTSSPHLCLKEKVKWALSSPRCAPNTKIFIWNFNFYYL